MPRLASIAGASALAAACGPRPPPAPWIERELGASHAAGPAAAPAAGSAAAPAIDPASLDADAIDALDEPTARAALDQVGDAAPAARLALRLARLAWHRGDDAVARALLSRIASAADRDQVAGAAKALAAQLAAPPVDPAVVAVLLPRSGRFAALGRELERAIRLAPAPGTRWLFLDTRGEPDGAVAAVDQAVARGAAAILGPVGVREAVAAARQAALRQVPIGLLAPEDGADPGAGVFRLVGSPADEGRAVARLAADDGFPTVAVLAPRDDVGQASAEAFVAEARRLGLQVTREGRYDPTGGKLEPDVKDFLDLVPARNPKFAEHLARHGKKGWATYTPELNFSLLYIPDRYDRAALVAAFLPYFNVELRTTEFPDPARLARKHGGVIPQVVQLIGGAGWHHPTLAVRGGAAVQGALIVDAFVGELGADTGAQFAIDFAQRAGRAPTAAAAEVHDAARVVAAARATAAGAADVRAALRAALARARLDDGACGPAAIDRDGELVREPAVLEVVGDRLELRP